MKEQKTYQAAIYLRLSKERVNEQIGESDSIVNQEALIRSYLEAYPEIEIRYVFKDDGWSGVYFERPSFQKMMQKIYDGEVDCVVVKDLSRLGRNHTETGKYISRVFPAFGVRFIAVNDHVDSLTQNEDLDNIIIPFKDLLNDSYSRDISIKIRSTLDIKRKQGLYVAAMPRFGYERNPDDKNRLVVDEAAAEVVRQIFQWTFDGMGNTAIAKKLNGMRFPAPREYRRLKKSGKKPVSDKNGWYPVAINRILRDETYTGVMTQGKFTTPNYKVKKVIQKPETEIDRIEDAFEPIIPKKQFELIQTLLARDVRTIPGLECVTPLCGYLYCADCGGNMVKKSVRRDGRLYRYYVCGEHRHDRSVCTNHHISVVRLEKAVLEAMDIQLRILIEVDEYMQSMGGISIPSPAVDKFQSQIAGVSEQKRRFLELSKSCYSDFQAGLLTEKEYRDMKAEYVKAVLERDEAMLRLEKEKRTLQERERMDLSWLEEWKVQPKLEKLSRSMVIAMIEKVLVYNGNRIRVVFRYENEIGEIYSYIAQRKQG